MAADPRSNEPKIQIDSNTRQLSEETDLFGDPQDDTTTEENVTTTDDQNTTTTDDDTTTQTTTTKTKTTPNPDDEAGKGKERTTQTSTETTTQPTVLAGKFNSEQELKNAFVNLGGNPDRYKSTAALEEAYEARQAEYNRARQQYENLDRLNETTTTTTQQPLDDEQILDQVDWNKVENARDLGKQLLGIVRNIMPAQQQQPSERELVERIAPILQEREEKMTALNTIETEVPRLKNDMRFRTAFARHIESGDYTRNVDGLREAMKDFLELAGSIADERQRQNTSNTENKRNAAPPPDGGEGLPDNTQNDEMDDIIDSFKARQNKFGL